MRIGLLASASSIHTAKIANGLADLGHSVTLFSLPVHNDADNLISENVETIYLKYGGGIGYYLNRNHLKKLIDERHLDVLNVHYASGYGTLARLTGFHPYALSVWGSDVYDFPYKNKTNSRIIKRNLSASDKIFSTSHAMAGQVVTLIPNKISVEDIVITPFGVDINEFEDIKQPRGNEPITIGFVKTISEIYGIEDLIRAYSMVKKQTSIPPTRLFIYGKGDQMQEMIQLSEDLDLEKDVTFFGYIPHKDVPTALKKMDIFCNPSRCNESFGVSVVEAMACGLPCITSNADGLSEVMINGKTGYTVPPNDPEALAEKLLTLIKDDELRNDMGKSSRQRVIQNYNWQENIKTIESALMDIVSP